MVIGLAGCPDDTVRPDVQRIDVYAHARVLPVDRPILTCSSAEFHLQVASGAALLTTLPASAFTFTIGGEDGGMRVPVPNQCFSATSDDGGVQFYRACFNALEPGVGYFLGIQVASGGETISETTFFRTTTCADGGMDGQVDASTDATDDIVPPDATDIVPSDASSDDAESDASMDAGEVG